MIGPRREHSGRPSKLISEFQKKWGLTHKQARRWFHIEPQLINCKSDEARRLILGTSILAAKTGTE